MRQGKEKAAVDVSSTPAAIETNRRQIVELQPLDSKTFDTLRKRFAKRGYRLQRVYRAGDGRPTYNASQGFGTRVLSHPHDVLALLSVVEGVST